MSFAKSVLFSIGLLLCFSALAATTRAFNFNNTSSHTVYVWVTVAEGVDIDEVRQVPTKILTLEPNTMAKLNFAYTRHWGTETALTVKFCVVDSRGCLDAMGEYSAFTIVPNGPTEWLVSRIWSAIIFPYDVTDNIYQMDRMIWNRESDFPIQIIFSDRHKQRHIKNRNLSHRLSYSDPAFVNATLMKKLVVSHIQ